MTDRTSLLSLGRIVGEGSAKSLAQDKAVAESYLARKRIFAQNGESASFGEPVREGVAA
jgi:hypothetical protein